ncbi:hypothetical protein PRIPAC_91582 [Pristionchus pacificus]|nr:hypothetical protein PRIPAC_91582 [Pristionchus pacificus]|eukprot:PDM62844.1 hypothetical protein PRIPAC_50059 [Pristionchus pacificus]
MVLRISFNDDAMVRFLHDEVRFMFYEIKSILKPSPSSKKELGSSPDSEFRTITFNVGNRYHGFESTEFRDYPHFSFTNRHDLKEEVHRLREIVKEWKDDAQMGIMEKEHLQIHTVIRKRFRKAIKDQKAQIEKQMEKLRQVEEKKKRKKRKRKAKLHAKEYLEEVEQEQIAPPSESTTSTIGSSRLEQLLKSVDAVVNI